MRYLYTSIFTFLSFIIPFGVFAYELKVEPDVSIGENYISDANLYIVSLHTWFNSTYEKDIVSASVDQTIGGITFGDLTLFGKNINITGESFGDVRTIGDVVSISGVINKDLIIIGRHVVVSADAIINGDTLILANSVELQGQSLGNTQVTANMISVSGSIVGQTTFTGSKILFDSGAKIQTDISYFSPQRAIINPGADIQKELNFNQIDSITQNDVIKKLFFAFVSFWAIIKLIATLFVLFILIHLFKIPVQKIMERVKEKPIDSFLLGIGSLIGLPLLIVILFGSLVLIPVSIIVLCTFIVMIMLLPAMSAIIAACFYQIYIQKNAKISLDFNLAVLMLILLTFINFIPYIGNVLMYVLYLVSFGAITRYLYDAIRRKKIHF